MELQKSYKVKLYDNGEKEFIQFVEAADVDEALKKAKNTFESRLYGLCEKFKGSEAQAACKISKLNCDLKFGFKGGFIRVYCRGLTIFEAYERAKQSAFLKEDQTLEIKEIYQAN